MIRRLGHEGQNVLVVALHRRGKATVRGNIPAKVRPALHRKAAPVRMTKLVHHADGRRFADPGPFIESVAAEEAGIALHLAQVQAAQQRLARFGGLVQGDHRVDPFFHPGHGVRVAGRQGSGRGLSIQGGRDDQGWGAGSNYDAGSGRGWWRRLCRVTASGDQQEDNSGWQPADQMTSRGSSVTVPSVISKIRTTGLSMSISETNT